MHIDIKLIVTLNESEDVPVDELDLLMWLTHPEVRIHLVEGGLPETVGRGGLLLMTVHLKSLRHATEFVKRLVEDFGLDNNMTRIVIN